MNPNYCYQVPVVVGAGVSGATVAMLKPEVVVYDKGRMPGGRLSSKLRNAPSSFDFGATMFSDLMKVRLLGKETNYSISEIWKSYSVNVAFKPINDNTHFYPENGMANLVSSMLGNVKPIQSHTLKNLKLTDEKTWNLNFWISPDKKIKTITAKSINLTLPIPQILEIFHSSEKNQNLKRWFDFLKNYNDYRKTLVSYFYWDEWKPNWKKLSLDPNLPIPVTTTLNRGEDWEYQSWESLKTLKIFIMVQPFLYNLEPFFLKLILKIGWMRKKIHL